MSNVDSEGVPVTKKKRLSFTLPTIEPIVNWCSEFNLDGKIEISQKEVGDGATSRVYVGSLHGMTVAVKQLKCYSPRLASCLIKAYECVFHLKHDNLVQVFGICPKAGHIVMEYCQKVIDGHTLRTLGDLLLYYGDDLPPLLRIAALSDVAEGLQYLHSHSLIHGDIKPHNVLVTGTGQEFIFKITDYSCIMHINSNQLSSRSSSLKQLMTPGYLAPELISDTGSYLNPTKASDVYSFAILAYEVAFCRDPWPNVSMQLIGSVRSGYRPVIPSNSSKFMSAIIQECWQHDSSSRPYASQISQLLGDHLDRLTSSDTHCSSASSTPITAVLECDAVSVGIDSNPLSTVSVCPILNHGGHNGSCDTVAAENTQTPLNCSNESMQSALYCTSESNGITHGGSSTPSRGTCNTDVSIETDLEILPQDSPGPVLASELALNTELVNSQTSNDVECMQIDYGHDRLAYKDLSQSSTNDASSIEEIKTALCIKEFKEFQIKTIDAIAHGHDVVLVQPTGSGKSLCFTVPALLNSRKVCIVIEPVVAIINNQVEALQKKGIDALALGRAAGNQRSKNYRRVFQSSDVPRLAFCTPEYLFGTPATSLSSGSAGQFHLLKAMQATLSVIVIDEAHKIFDRMPTYRPAFDEMHQLKELSCPIVAMSATLTSLQIDALEQKYLRSDKCLMLTKGVHRDNLHLCLQRYRRRKLVCVEQLDDEDESDKENAPEGETTTSTSMWADSINKIDLMFKDHSTVLYLDFAKDVEEITDILRQKSIKAGRYTGQISVSDQKQADKMFQQGETSVLVATESYELGVDNPNVNQVIRIGCPRNLGVFLQEIGRAGRKPDCTAQGLLLFNEYIDDKRLGQWLKAALDSSANDPKVETVRLEILFTYTQAWRFIYSMLNKNT